VPSLTIPRTHLNTSKLAYSTVSDLLLHCRQLLSPYIERVDPVFSPYIERAHTLFSPYIEHAEISLSPYIERANSLLASLQLSIAPDSAPTPLVELLPYVLLAFGTIVTSALLMRRLFGLGRGSPSYTRPISGNNAVDPHRAEDILTIKHGANEYLFKYPVNTIASHALNVGHVRDKCAEITGVHAKCLSLVCAGRQLKEKEDSVTLQILGIEHGATILAMGSGAAPPRPSPSPQPKPIRLGPAETIEAVREHVVTTLLPLVNDFISGQGGEMADKREDTHRRLGETIMAELLKLDGVETEDPQVRARRKEVVREIQGTLDSLDRALRESAQ
jgi:hypothetical protein